MAVPKRSALGWALALFVGSLLGGFVSMVSVRVFAPTLLYTDQEECAPAATSASASSGTPLASGGFSAQSLMMAAANESSGSAASAGQAAADGFVPGSAKDVSTVEHLLKRNEELRDSLAQNRRKFLWTSKLKISQLKGTLKQVKAIQERKALEFLWDDRQEAAGDAALPQELQEIMKKEWDEAVGKWQEVDLPTLPEPMPVSVESLKAVIDRAHKAAVWGPVLKCADGLRQLEDLTERISRATQKKLDALSESALAQFAKQRVMTLWHGAAEWADAWRGQGTHFTRYAENQEQRAGRAEISYWAEKFSLLWPLEGPEWFEPRGLDEAATTGEGVQARDKVLAKLNALEDTFKEKAERLSKIQKTLEIFLGTSLTSAKESCEVSDAQLEGLLLNAGSSIKGFCSSKELDKEGPGGPVAPAYVWRREWNPDREAELLEQLNGEYVSLADASPPVKVSVLVVVQWSMNFMDVFNRLWGCSGGLRGKDGLGESEHLTTEFLIAMDSNVASGFRETLLQLLNDHFKPFFITRAVWVTTGAEGLSLARGYNVLAELARGEVIVNFEETAEFPWSQNCNWLWKTVRPFNTWPRLGASGGWQGQMALFNTPGADYLQNMRASWEPTHNRLKDPELQARFQFLLGTVFAPIAYRRSAFLAVGGYNEAAVGGSNVLEEYDLCRRMWLAGWQVGMAFVGGPDKLGLSKRSEIYVNRFKETPLGKVDPVAFSKDLENRIVSEVKRMNRYLKPVPIWE